MLLQAKQALILLKSTNIIPTAGYSPECHYYKKVWESVSVPFFIDFKQF